MPNPESPATIQTKGLKRLHKLSTEMVDLTENLLESKGTYSNDFVGGLKDSLKQERAGNTKKIQSLSDIL